MSDAAPVNARSDGQIRAKKPRNRLAYSLGALFCALTAICFYQAYRTNQQILKYYTPAPVVDYGPDVVPYQFTDADFVHPLDPRPATIHLQERVQAITERIAELRSRGETDRATKMQSRLDAILANRDGPYPVDGALQLHAIGMYRGPARIRVSYTSAPLVIALCAYDPSTWSVEIDPGVQVKKVILAGYHQQQLQGVPETIPVEGNTTAGRNSRYAFYADTPLEAIPAAERFQELTGLNATTFQTLHSAEGAPLVVGPGGTEWTAKMTLHALDALYEEAVRESRTRLAKELVAHIFPEIACTSPDRYGMGYDASFALHSIFGPYAQTMQPLNRATAQFAIDPRGPSVFSFNWREGVVAFDPQSSTLTRWPVNGLDIRPHGEACLAFDTKRQRLLVWGDGLAAIDVLKKEATLLRKGNPAIAALTYSSADDLLYACCAPYDGDSSNVMLSEIRTFNHRGAELSRTKLAVPIGGQSMPYPAGTVKLTMVGDKLLITNLGSYDGNHQLITSKTNYVVDPKTGKLLFACRRQPR